jgi:hypothetical protein
MCRCRILSPIVVLGTSARAKENKKMRANLRRAPLFSGLALLAFVVTGGCSPTLNGARAVEAGYVPQTLVAYAAEGDTAAGAQYWLVKDTRGLAVYETTPGREAILIDARWRDGNGDHFVVWTAVGDAEYILVPLDHHAPAYRWVLPRGLYTIEKGPMGIQRPMPKIDLEASTKLTPRGPVR